MLIEHSLELIEKTSARMVFKPIQKASIIVSVFNIGAIGVFIFLFVLSLIGNIYESSLNCMMGSFFIMIFFVAVALQGYIKNAEITWVFDKPSKILTIKKYYGLRTSIKTYPFSHISEPRVEKTFFENIRGQKTSAIKNYKIKLKLDGKDTILTDTYTYDKSEIIVEYIKDFLKVS
jgi:hypothetical protein